MGEIVNGFLVLICNTLIKISDFITRNEEDWPEPNWADNLSDYLATKIK
jgi:hypothetical protein